MANHPAQPPGSPKLHSLPDNTLNPLGLLAEASLANRRAQAASRAESRATDDSQPRLGVASDLYFKPGACHRPVSYRIVADQDVGPMTILPLRRLFIERQIQPEMLSFVSTEEVVALFKIFFENMNVSYRVAASRPPRADFANSINAIYLTPPFTHPR